MHATAEERAVAANVLFSIASTQPGCSMFVRLLRSAHETVQEAAAEALKWYSGFKSE